MSELCPPDKKTKELFTVLTIANAIAGFSQLCLAILISIVSLIDSNLETTLFQPAFLVSSDHRCCVVQAN